MKGMGVQWIGLAIAAAGLIFWYSTPGDVIVAPIVVIVLGLAVTGVGWLLQRGGENSDLNDLTHRTRATREDDPTPEA